MATQVQHFLDKTTDSFSYVAYDEVAKRAAIIDPVLDYDQAAGRTSTKLASKIVAFVKAQALTVDWILDTHAHADHLSAAVFLQQQLGGAIAIGQGICEVQKTFRDVFNHKCLKIDGTQFDRLFADGDTFEVGQISARVINTPGHTSDSVSYHIGDAIFVGDSLFAPDLGSARTDFPGGDARTLYQSTQKLLALPPTTRVFLCHDYPPADRKHEPVHLVRDHRERNIHVGTGISEDEFVAMREARDATLSMPKLIIPAVQVNIRAGRFPEPEDNGTSYLKVPINRL